MRGCLRVVRGNEVRMALPGSIITIKPDGTLWVSGNPILGVDDPQEKIRIADLIRAKKIDEIPTIYFTRLGDNPNGLWTGTDEEWANYPLKTKIDEEAAEKKQEQAKVVKIYLSSRGWGDYSKVEWVGNITRSYTEILAECKNLLASEHDVDHPNQSDSQLIQKIIEARSKWEKAPAREAAREKAEKEDTQRKIETGYCFGCETWCHGDCGHYSKNPQVKFRRDLTEAIREQNSGIND